MPINVGSIGMSRLAVVRFTVIKIAIAENALIESAFMEPPVSLRFWDSLRIINIMRMGTPSWQCGPPNQ